MAISPQNNGEKKKYIEPPWSTVLAPFLFTLYPSDCSHSGSSRLVITLAYNFEITGKRKNDDDSVSMEEIQFLSDGV